MQTILYHAKLYVARGDFRSALCAEDGIIRAVGSDAEILALARPGCRRIDCAGRTVVPGFNDSHMHLMQLAQPMLKTDYGQYLRRVAEGEI